MLATETRMSRRRNGRHLSSRRWQAAPGAPRLRRCRCVAARHQRGALYTHLGTPMLSARRSVAHRWATLGRGLVDTVQKWRRRMAESKGTTSQVALEEVQGNITPGFRKDYQAFLFLRFPDGANDVQAWLKEAATVHRVCPPGRHLQSRVPADQRQLRWRWRPGLALLAQHLGERAFTAAGLRRLMPSTRSWRTIRGSLRRRDVPPSRRSAGAAGHPRELARSAMASTAGEPGDPADARDGRSRMPCSSSGRRPRPISGRRSPISSHSRRATACR